MSADTIEQILIAIVVLCFGSGLLLIVFGLIPMALTQAIEIWRDLFDTIKKN